MKISLNWLKEYLPIEIPVAEISALLTQSGLEVESVEDFVAIKGGLQGLVVGEVKTCDRHPNADKLSLTTVDVGGEQPLQIVCGAPNVAAGQKVIVATVGTTVHPVSGEPFEIKKSKIRGEVSEGMICAEDEIGLGESHAGIMILPADVKVGTTAKEFFKLEEDSIIEIGLTPNRADAASHYGVARDLAAVYNTQEKLSGTKNKLHASLKNVDEFKEGNTSKASVDVIDTEACPRYSAVVIENVKVADSPDWLKNRLLAIGLSPINNIVDITNFVLHETGQPLHAFDMSKIKRKVVVRSAKEGEKFVTLDGKERILAEGNLMICDEKDPMCIAGVFGGFNSGVSETTTTIFLESAYFNPASIRKTSKHHGLKTDASFRFERGTDPEMTLYALKRAALLMKEIAGGTIASPVTDIYPAKVEEKSIVFSLDYLKRFGGVEIDKETVIFILENLDITVTDKNTDSLTLKVPAFKVDVERPADVVEEVLRVYGFDKVPIGSKISSSLPGPENPAVLLQKKVSDYLSAAGFNEALNNSLTGPEYAVSENELVKLLNPLSTELGVLRQSMIFSGLETLQYNRNRKNADLRTYEFGKVYFKQAEGGYIEKEQLAIFMSGKTSDEYWKQQPANSDFFLLKGVIENLLAVGGIGQDKLQTEEASDPLMAYGLTYKTTSPLITFGALKKDLAKKFDLAADVFVAIVDWKSFMKLSARNVIRFKEISKFPAVKRDLSMLIETGVTYAQVEALAYKTEKKLLRKVNLFDIYQGDKIEAGKKSYAVSFVLQDDEQTLNDKQIDKTMERLMQVYEKELGAVIRKS